MSRIVIVIGLLAMVTAACSSSPTTTGETGEAAPPPAAPEPAAAGTPPGDQEEHLSAVVAEVNGRPIYRAFYEQSLSYMRNRIPTGQEESTLERYLNAKFDALERLVDDELIYQHAVREGHGATEQEVKAELARASRTAGGEERFFSGMRAQGISRTDAVEGIRRRLSIDKYLQSVVMPGITATDEEMLTFYNENQARFTPELWVKVQQIVIRCPRSAPEDQTRRARERASKILANLRAGQPFEVMAREYSEDSTAAIGGSIGFVKRGVIPPELDAVAFSIAPGQVSDPIQTDTGFHIIKVAERRGGKVTSFESVKEDCRRAVLTRKKADAIEQLTTQLRADARIVSYLQ